VASRSPIESKLSFHRLPPLSGEDFLLSLGTRVRDLRNRRGMTRRTLARESDVSERHLAQLESGEGNISILLLRRIAAVLSVSLEQLFAPAQKEDERNSAQFASQKQIILRFIERLPSHRLEEAAARLMRDFGPEQNQRLARLALIGLRGAGKSTLGSRLAAERDVPFIELDQEIEKDTGMPLAEIFSLYGQSGYRAIEKRTLERVLRASERAVISVGGGIVSEKETYDYLLAHCHTIWLQAQPEEHMSRVIAQGDFRAMAGSDRAMEDLRRILESREPLYRKADAAVDTSGESVDESFTKLKAALAAAAQ
jgi:XRE family transcriptional regulator, aerobic/anaerobic benzoate catabolism transcriptional regulator